jgi:AraC family transcriptional regulator, carnitine catabolism transcriptional activator
LSAAPGPQDFHFLVLPEFSFLAFISAIEPLRVANHFRPDSYRWHVLSCDGAPVVATNGMVLNAEASFMDARGVQTLFVVSGFNTLNYFRPELGAWLRGLQRRGTTLGAIDGGAFVLAESGVLRGTPAAMHWESHAPFAERYPELVVSESLFEISERCISCAGGTATIDMMLALIMGRHGLDLATRISDWFVLGRIRGKSHYQRMEIAARFGLHNDKTIQIIKLMQEHIEDPLSVDDLAGMVGVTRRQLERLFRSHLQLAPSQFYLGVRLDRARELLQQTGMAITEVSVACGFGSSSYFSRAYRTRFGVSPKGDRIEAPALRRESTTESRYAHLP